MFGKCQPAVLHTRAGPRLRRRGFPRGLDVHAPAAFGKAIPVLTRKTKAKHLCPSPPLRRRGRLLLEPFTFPAGFCIQMYFSQLLRLLTSPSILSDAHGEPLKTGCAGRRNRKCSIICTNGRQETLFPHSARECVT